MTRLFTGRRLLGLTLLAATMCASVQPLSAAPSERIRINITLADGSQLEVTRMGDEHFTYYMTDEGETIVRDSLKRIHCRA